MPFSASRRNGRVVSLDDLGVRICVMGPSNSGKSTLAQVIGGAQDLAVVHLDQLRHIPGSQWELRADDAFAALHEDAIRGERWVIEGNYSTLLPQRLERATGFILLDSSAASSVRRYLQRTWSRRERVGGLGTADRVRWNMIRYILGTGQANQRRYRALYKEVSLPKVFLRNRTALGRFYRDEIFRGRQ
jgi:adenylate kinase family enzyme